METLCRYKVKTKINWSGLDTEMRTALGLEELNPDGSDPAAGEIDMSKLSGNEIAEQHIRDWPLVTRGVVES